MPNGPVLVTGGCGFIGSNLVRRLVKARGEVRVFDNLSRGSLRLISDVADVRIVRGDIRNPGALKDAMAGVRTVIHLAAAGSVVDSVMDPAENFENNVVGTFNVLNCARLAGVEKIVFASTGGALIGNAAPPVDENSVPRPISPYGASKLCGEGYCHSFGQAYGIQTVALRFANVYGPYSAHKKGAITAFIRGVLTGRPIQIFGDGKATRDFLYVEDLCAGIERALMTQLAPGSVFHLASGVETQIGELARMVAMLAGRPEHPIVFVHKRVGEVERNFARADAARKALGFQPAWNLETGLMATIEWFRNANAELSEPTSDA